MDELFRFYQIAASVQVDLEVKRRRLYRRRKRRWLATALLAVLLVSFTASGLAYASLNTNTNAEVNRFGFGQAKISIDEDFDGWDKKEVKLAIEKPWDGLVPGAARVMFVPYILDENSGDYIPCDLGAMAKPDPVTHKMVLGDIVLEFAADWESHWFYKDGFFYYKTVLYPETGRNETPVLLKKVSLNTAVSGLDDKYDGSIARVKVEALASILQAGGSAGEPGKVLAAEWGVKVTGDVVSPMP